uniref:EF-hand domain-containing protein n=1 Tax=Tetradesmus obliquus TaxID=3088 RepID=A0A383WNS5_TETOB|eukprot:jgi/Sobl393_1/19195/SZX78819.1
MQLLDPTLLISLVGIPSKHLKRALNKELDVYSRAVSSEGLLCIRKYWDTHCSTVSKLPAIALLDQSSCPRGISDTDFLALLSRLTSLQQWQIWDLWYTLDVHGCGFVGCPEFTLLVVLMCAAVAGQQMQAVHAYCSSICRVFTGAHVGSAFAGLTQCCQLLQLPFGCLVTAVRQLQLQLDVVYKPVSVSNSNGSSCCCKLAAVATGKPSSSSCCPCSSCSCRHLGGVQTSWQEPCSGASSTRTCVCSSKAAERGPCWPASSGGCSRRAGCSTCSSSVLEPELGLPGTGSHAAVAVIRTAGTCKCQMPSQARHVAGDEDVQLLLFTTIQLAQGVLLPYQTGDTIDAGASEESKRTHSNMLRGLCCIGCMSF